MQRLNYELGVDTLQAWSCHWELMGSPQLLLYQT